MTHLVPKISLGDGVEIPQLGFGTLHVTGSREDTTENAAAVAEMVGDAIEAGYRMLDTAQMYGNERGIGLAIARSAMSRDDLFITTKLGNGNHRPDDVRRSLEDSLDRLGLDRVDLFLMHWPLPTLYDGDYVSTWRAMIQAAGDGLTRAVGVSNFQPAHLERIIAATGTAPAVNQVEVHPYFRNSDVLTACAGYGITVQAWSPLGQGDVLTDPLLAQIAAAHGRTPAQVVLRWHLQQGRVVFPKSGNPDRMKENLDVFDFNLTSGELDAIDGLDRGEAGRRGPHPDTFDLVPSGDRPTPTR